jgi:hypothetical protein
MLRTGCADVVRTQVAAGRVATTPISASIVGAMKAQEAMKIIHMKDGDSTPFKTLSGKMWYFEGMTNTVNTYKFASWKNQCPAHEQWNDILECKDLSAKMKVGEVLSLLKKILNVSNVEINMRNNKFVEKIISEKPEKEFELRIPESKLDEAIQTNEELRTLNYRTIFHKIFFENIDDTFPYKEMTLAEIGIPIFDIIQVSTEKGVRYVELTKDAAYYGL